MQDVVDLLSFQAEKKQINLSYEIKLGAYDLQIYSDNNRIKQILINLIGNSLKFTFDGYVKVTVEQSK